MRKSKRNSYAVAFFVIVALIGLSVLQVYFLTNAAKQKEQAFEQNVMAALNSAVEKLQAFEATRRVFVSPQRSFSNTQFDILMKDTSEVDTETDGDSIFIFMEWTAEEKEGDGLPIQFKNDTLRYRIPKQQRVRLNLFDLASGENVIAMDTVVSAGVHLLSLSDVYDHQGTYMMRLSTDSLSYVMRVDDERNYSITLDRTEEQRGHLVQTIVNSMSFEEFESAVNRLEPETVDSVLGATLAESGINLDYSFGVIARADSTTVFARPEDATDDLVASKFKARVFPYELFSDRHDLAVDFPGRSAYIGGDVLLLSLTSALFLALIAVGFILLYRTIAAQHRFADHLVGFINNMTHEFKTPISTVALASEAISRDDVLADRDRIETYNSMIRDENRRMKEQVEKILQVALIEEGDFDLDLSDVDLHEVIDNAVSKLEIRISKRGGDITKNLSARHSVVSADPVHITNVVYNLLDNAEKYSPESPHIAISTRNRKDGVVVAVEDRGRGIAKEDIERIFDKYYRVQSGNVHDVKGFGLGLSYVKLMAEAHGGDVAISSKIEQGTRIELYLPFNRSS